jgi:hypothetical protein
MSAVPPADIRAYLEIRTAGPSGWSPDASRLLISSDLPGDGPGPPARPRPVPRFPVAVEDLEQLTDFDEPIGAGYLPADPGGWQRGPAAARHRPSAATSATSCSPPPTTRRALPGPDDLDPLVIDEDHIHRPGGVTRDGRWLAYATNRGDGVAFDTWVRDLHDRRGAVRLRLRRLDLPGRVLARRALPRRQRAHDPRRRQPGPPRRPRGGRTTPWPTRHDGVT